MQNEFNIEEIEKRHKRDENGVESIIQCHADRATLLRLFRSRAPWVDREGLAKWFFDRMPYDSTFRGNKPDWVPGGNSFKQDEARASAHALIASGRLNPMPSEEKIARLLAEHLGPGWDQMYQDKREWIDDRAARQPDVNGPFRDDCTAAARAILALSDAKP